MRDWEVGVRRCFFILLRSTSFDQKSKSKSLILTPIPDSKQEHKSRKILFIEASLD